MANKAAQGAGRPAAPKPLLVVAGLPRPTANSISGTIQRLRKVNVVATPFGHGGPPQYSAKAVKSLLRRACEFALRDEKGEPVVAIPDPTRLLLAYVPGGNLHELVDAFGFSAQLLELEVPGWQYPKGKEWRELIEPVSDAVVAAFDASAREPYRAVRSRLEAASTSEVLMLPPRNFETDDGPLAKHLLAAFQGQLELSAVGAQIEVRRFLFEDLSSYYRRTGEKDKRYPVDARGLVFPSGTGLHGDGRVRPANLDLTTAQLRSLLETHFRLGTPLRPGFQHDVQWPNDRKLASEAFICTTDGSVEISGSHANVYANDHVREAAEGRKDVVKGGQ